jgi:pyruvate-formate lyase
MENKKIISDPDELIVGERGPAAQSHAHLPGSVHPLPGDLDIISGREKVAFSVDEAVRTLYREEIIPFWQGHTIREKLFSHLPEAWKAAYAAGIFTEFQEQRSPGHTACGDTIYRKGFLDLKSEIRDAVDRLDFFNDPGSDG